MVVVLVVVVAAVVVVVVVVVVVAGPDAGPRRWPGAGTQRRAPALLVAIASIS